MDLDNILSRNSKWKRMIYGVIIQILVIHLMEAMPPALSPTVLKISELNAWTGNKTMES